MTLFRVPEGGFGRKQEAKDEYFPESTTRRRRMGHRGRGRISGSEPGRGEVRRVEAGPCSRGTPIAGETGTDAVRSGEENWVPASRAWSRWRGRPVCHARLDDAVAFGDWRDYRRDCRVDQACRSASSRVVHRSEKPGERQRQLRPGNGEKASRVLAIGETGGNAGKVRGLACGTGPGFRLTIVNRYAIVSATGGILGIIAAAAGTRPRLGGNILGEHCRCDFPANGSGLEGRIGSSTGYSFQLKSAS